MRVVLVAWRTVLTPLGPLTFLVMRSSGPLDSARLANASAGVRTTVTTFLAAEWHVIPPHISLSTATSGTRSTSGSSLVSTDVTLG